MDVTLLREKVPSWDQYPFNLPVVKNLETLSLHQQSHGESFLAFFSNRLGGDGFYIVDEPEAALSPTRQLSLLVMLHDLVKPGGHNSSLLPIRQLLWLTHDLASSSS